MHASLFFRSVRITSLWNCEVEVVTHQNYQHTGSKSSNQYSFKVQIDDTMEKYHPLSNMSNDFFLNRNVKEN